MLGERQRSDELGAKNTAEEANHISRRERIDTLGDAHVCRGQVGLRAVSLARTLVFGRLSEPAEDSLKSRLQQLSVQPAHRIYHPRYR